MTNMAMPDHKNPCAWGHEMTSLVVINIYPWVMGFSKIFVSLKMSLQMLKRKSDCIILHIYATMLLKLDTLNWQSFCFCSGTSYILHSWISHFSWTSYVFVVSKKSVIYRNCFKDMSTFCEDNWFFLKITREIL